MYYSIELLYIYIYNLLWFGCYFIYTSHVKIAMKLFISLLSIDVWILGSQAIEYDTGDVLEILPGQDSAAVDAFIRRCNLDPDSLITVSLLRLVNVRIYIKNILILTYIKKHRSSWRENFRTKLTYTVW